MSNLQPTEAWIYQDKETLKLTQLLYDSIKTDGMKKVLERVLFKLDPYKNEYKDTKNRVEKCLNLINDEGYIKRPYDNDIARALVWCLKINTNENKNSKKFKEPIIVSSKDQKSANNITKHNTTSYGELRQYDPQKNGINYLKHGLFFDDIPSMTGDEYGSLVTHTHQNKEDRSVIISRFKADDVYRYIVSIVIMSPTSNVEDDEIYNKAGELFVKIFPEMINDNGVTAEFNIDLEKVQPILMQFNDIRSLIARSQPMRYITSWAFDKHNFDKIVMSRIKDENLSEDIVQQLKERSVEILNGRWHNT